MITMLISNNSSRNFFRENCFQITIIAILTIAIRTKSEDINNK